MNRAGEVDAFVEHGVEAGKADRAAEIAGQVEQPDAFFSRSGSSVPSEMLVIGTIASIMPKPRRTC